MQGIDLARQWYENILLPELEKEFPESLGSFASGIAGRGSECFGFDDEISRDHDFTSRVTLWMTSEHEEQYGFKLMRIYQKAAGRSSSAPESRLGENERGVVLIEDFLLRRLGYAHVPRSWQQWLYTPEYAFAETVNGSIFSDVPGVFSRIREDIRHGMPEDVRLKKIAAYSVMMAQSGQYNYTRCLKHGEPGAASVALSEFIRYTAMFVHQLNFAFTPYYKWMIRSLRELPLLGELALELDRLPESQDKNSIIEKICYHAAQELRNEGLSSTASDYLENHAFEVMSNIRNREIRALHIMDGI